MNKLAERKRLCFYSNDYSLIINFNGSVGTISGEFCLSSQYDSTIFPFKSIYSKDDIIKFAFSLEWSISTRENYGFTMFSGQVINPNVLILDWLMVGNEEEDYSVKGTDFLYSRIYNNHRKKMPTNIKPFPVEFASYFESI
jgi:hypothetical protein